MKEITYVLTDRIQDEETGNCVVLSGVKVTGTPLQVGMIFDALKNLPGRPDILVDNEADRKIFNMGKDALEQARSTHSDYEGDYEDPDISDEKDEERSNWRLHNEKYWTKFCNYLNQQGSHLQSNTSRYDYYITFRIGIPGYALKAIRVAAPKRSDHPHISVRLVIEGPDAEDSFHKLQERRKEIEKELGEPHEWRPRERDKIVTLSQHADPKDENDWPRQHEWLLTKLEKLNEVFHPRIIALST